MERRSEQAQLRVIKSRFLGAEPAVQGTHTLRAAKDFRADAGLEMQLRQGSGARGTGLVPGGAGGKRGFLLSDMESCVSCGSPVQIQKAQSLAPQSSRILFQSCFTMLMSLCHQLLRLLPFLNVNLSRFPNEMGPCKLADSSRKPGEGFCTFSVIASWESQIRIYAFARTSHVSQLV